MTNWEKDKKHPNNQHNTAQLLHRHKFQHIQIEPINYKRGIQRPTQTSSFIFKIVAQRRHSASCNKAKKCHLFHKMYKRQIKSFSLNISKKSVTYNNTDLYNKQKHQQVQTKYDPGTKTKKDVRIDTNVIFSA